MFTTQWHFTLSAQRWSSVNLPTQRLLSVLFPTQKWSLVHSSAQRQSSVSSLCEVCDVLYDRPLDQGLLSGATEGHLPHQSGHGIHVSHPITLSFTLWLMLIVAIAGLNNTAILNGFGGTSQTSSGDWSLCKHVITPMKPGGGMACQTISDLLVGKGGPNW